MLASFRECCDEPVARAVVVTGPAGSGKSRLRQELEARIASEHRAGDARPVTVLSARARAEDAHRGAALLARMLRDAGGVVPDDAIDIERTKLDARVSRNVAPQDRARVSQGLGLLVERPQTSTETSAPLATSIREVTIQAELRRAWEDFVAAECAAGPVLMVLEDLHHADAASLRLVDSALDKLRDRPLMVLGLGRPALFDHFPKLWAERGAHDLRLGPLSSRAAELLVRHLLGDALDGQEVATLIRRAGGNAYVLEELLTAAAQGGSTTPVTVLSLGEAELSLVPADGRRVLRAASLFGATFPARGVAALLGDAGLADGWIADLAGRGLVSPAAVRPGWWSFRSELLWEAAGATLTRNDRALGRRLADEWAADNREEPGEATG